VEPAVAENSLKFGGGFFRRGCAVEPATISCANASSYPSDASRRISLWRRSPRRVVGHQVEDGHIISSEIDINLPNISDGGSVMPT